MTHLDRWRDLVVRRPHADAAMACVVLGATLVTTAAGPDGARLSAAGLVTAAVACGVLVLRRSHPVVVLAASAGAAEAYLVLLGGQHGAMVLAAPLIALYTVAETTTRRRALLIGVLVVLALGGLHTLGRPASWLGAENVALAALGGLAVAAGDSSRNRRAYLAEVEARARQAEADRAAEAARLVTEERLRIARDLHDAVGHQLALIYVQAGVGSHVLPDRTDQADEALHHIRTASKTALAELSDTVLLLRRPGESTPTGPVAGLAGLDDLVDTFRRSGLHITHHVEGEARPIAAAADATAYRVVQEALTNVCKHAGPTNVDVTLGYDDTRLLVVVDNRPSGRPPVGGPGEPGHALGIVGMRERVTAIGGTLRAGPRPDGGFRVTAALPLTAAAVP